MNFLFPYMARWKAVNWTRYHQIFTHLAKLGHNVHIIQTPASNSIETNFQEIEVESPDNLYIHEVDINSFIWNCNFPLNKLVRKGYYSFRSIKKVKEIVKKFKIDVLFLYNIPQYPLMKVSPCVKVFDLADDYIAMLDHELGRCSNPLILNIGQYILNKMIEQSDITLAVSQVLADSIKIENKEKVKILPNGVNLDGFSSGCGANIRKKYKKPIIGFIGSFEYFIDFDLILNTAEKMPNYTFLLVGTGREFENIRKKIEYKALKNVILTGGVPNYEIAKYIDAMDICLNVFKKIGISHSACPIKLFEYLAMKKPVISTRLKETKNIDKEFLFYADTVDELEKRIKEIIKNEILVAKYIEKGYNTIKKEYEWSNIVKELLSVLNDREGLIWR